MRAKCEHPHIYDDTIITSERLQAFAMAPLQEQRKALALLRTRAAEDHGAMHMALSLIVATLLVILGPSVAFQFQPALPAQVIVVLIASITLSLLVTIVFMFAILPLMRDAKRKERATTWLGAFEDELARLHRLRGPAARRWQRRH